MVPLINALANAITSLWLGPFQRSSRFRPIPFCSVQSRPIPFRPIPFRPIPFRPIQGLAAMLLILALSLGSLPHGLSSAQASNLDPLKKASIVPDSGSFFHISGSRPDAIGLHNNKLSGCPATPNCVSSQDSDDQHQIDALPWAGEPAAAIAALKKILRSQERVKLISSTNNYLYAEYTSRWFGFVDDVEFHVNPTTQTIEVRSGSRLGESDLGVNRTRIEAIRKTLATLAPPSPNASRIPPTLTAPA